jgi:phage head maturation protease
MSGGLPVADDMLAYRLAQMERAFNPREARGFGGKWVHVGGSDFTFDGPAGGDGHVRAIMSAADVIGQQPGMADAATDVRNAGKAVARRDLAAANRHLDGAAYLDSIYAGGSNRNDIEAIRKSLARVPKGAVTEPGRPAVPSSLGVHQGRLRGKPVAPGLVGAYASATRTAETATASTVHEPVGTPGGPGLWKHKTWQLPPYIQHLANDLKAKVGESRAIEMAVGIVRNWSEGHDGKGNKVSAEVQAAAAKNIAQWDAMKARTRHGAARSSAMADDQYDADGLSQEWDRLDDLPDLSGVQLEDLDAAASEGSGFNDWHAGEVSRAAKLGSGARFAALKAKLAAKGINNPGALAAKIGRAKYGKSKFGALAQRARKGKGGPAPAMRAATAGEIFRYWPLEECRIMSRSEGGEYASGRVVEAYAAIYNTPAEIKDHEGHYEEEIDRGAFSDVLRAISPERNRGFWNATCLYNHGMTVHGTPAERFSLPAGVAKHISSESKGLLTRTEYANTPLGEELLELVNMGALRSQSFTGGIVRSDPTLRGPGDKYRRAYGGALQRVKRLVLGLREYGLTPFAAYSGAEVLGVRMQLPGSLLTEEEWEEEDTSADTGHGGSPEEENVSRSTGNRLYRLRAEEALRAAGIELS